MSRYQLGVWWEEPGYKTARIAPVPLDLTWAFGSVPTPHGTIEAAWERSDQSFDIEVKLPQHVAGIVELPVSADEYTEVKAEGLTPQRIDGRWQFRLSSGTSAVIQASR